MTNSNHHGRHLRAVALCALLAAAPAARAQASITAQSVLHASELQADVVVLRSLLEQLHPGLYRYNTKREMDDAFSSLSRDFGHDQTLEAAYLRLSRFTAQIRCGHSYPNFFNQSKAITKALFERDGKLPFFYRWIDGRMIVISDFTASKALPVGSEISAINGADTREILRRLMPLARADGSNDAKRIDLLELQGADEFETADVYLPMLYPRWGAHYLLRVRAPGSGTIETVAADGITYQERERTVRVLHPDASGTEPLFTMRYLLNGSALLTMPTWEMYKTKWDWKKWTNDALDEVIAKGAPALVIDLRGNEGGNDVGDLILARLAYSAANEQPAARLVRYRSVPQELRPYLDTWDKSVMDWGTRAVALSEPWPTAPAVSYYQQPDDDDDAIDPAAGPHRKFVGKVFVLIDASNSSATFRFDRIVQQQHLGTLVGLPTGGNQRGINGGQFFFVKLPHSKLEVDVPLIGYFPRTSQPDAGLAPDIRVERSASDIAAGVDAGLARVQQLVGGSYLSAKFTGSWTGTLEYRDYRTNERVFLPTWLAVSESEDHRALDFRYIYDDGPSKTVREHVTVMLDAQTNTASLVDHDETSGDKLTASVYRASGPDDPAKAGKQTFVLSGSGTDDDKPVDVRITIVVERNLLTWRKDIRAAGSAPNASFDFRDGYVLTRAQPPAAP